MMTSTLLLAIACGDSVYKPDLDTGTSEAETDEASPDADGGPDDVDMDSPDTDGGDDESGDDEGVDTGTSPTDDTGTSPTDDTGTSPTDDTATGDTGADPTDTGLETEDTGTSDTGGDTTGGTSEGAGETGGDTTGGDEGTDPSAETIDYCHIQWPCGTTAVAGGEMETVYIWVYESGVTDAEGEGEGIEVQLGIGTHGSIPNEDWTWFDATYNMDKVSDDGALANDEYAAVGTAPLETINHDYAGRTRISDGPWLLCDLGGECGGHGSNDGYSPFTTGQLSVTSP